MVMYLAVAVIYLLAIFFCKSVWYFLLLMLVQTVLKSSHSGVFWGHPTEIELTVEN